MTLPKRRKHRSQMQHHELQYAESKVHKCKNWLISEHAKQRINQKEIDKNQLLMSLRFGKLIEVSQDRQQSVCLLIRNDFPVEAVCVVVSLPDYEVITAFKNHPNDNHLNLDMSEYQWDGDAKEVIQNLLKSQETFYESAAAACFERTNGYYVDKEMPRMSA